MGDAMSRPMRTIAILAVLAGCDGVTMSPEGVSPEAAAERDYQRRQVMLGVSQGLCQAGGDQQCANRAAAQRMLLQHERAEDHRHREYIREMRRQHADRMAAERRRSAPQPAGWVCFLAHSEAIGAWGMCSRTMAECREGLGAALARGMTDAGGCAPQEYAVCFDGRDGRWCMSTAAGCETARQAKQGRGEHVTGCYPAE